jgi:hypothetical protein
VSDLEVPSGITPAKQRQQASKQALIESGGRRVSVNLPRAAVQDLERVMARENCGATEAVIAALHLLRRKI